MTFMDSEREIEREAHLREQASKMCEIEWTTLFFGNYNEGWPPRDQFWVPFSLIFS